MTVPAAMGTAIAINFQPTGGGKAAITGDFVALSSELNPLITALRDNGIEVTAIHNHMVGEEPRAFFVHFWATTTRQSSRSDSARRSKPSTSRRTERAQRRCRNDKSLRRIARSGRGSRSLLSAPWPAWLRRPGRTVGQMGRELADERGWLTEEEMREAVAICQSLPGPLAIQVGVYIAYLRAGFWGAWAGGWAFILPNFVIVVGLGALYVYLGDLRPVTAIF